MLSTIRHDEVFKARDHNSPLTLIGAGAIGSRIWAALVELGLTNMAVYDYDVVESHNLANQVYAYNDIGKTKVDALFDWTFNKIGHEPVESMQFINAKIDEQMPVRFEGTVILAVDSIAARQMIVEKLVNESHPVFHVFDTRMASTHGDIIHFNPANPDEVESYISALPSDEEAEVSSCGSSLTVGTTASIIANLAVWQVMHQRANPEAMDDTINIFFKPLCVSTGVAR